MAARGLAQFPLCTYVRNLKHLLLWNQWLDMNTFWQEWSLGDLLQKKLKLIKINLIHHKTWSSGVADLKRLRNFFLKILLLKPISEFKTRTHSMARHCKSPRSRRNLLVIDPLTPSQGHQFYRRLKFSSCSSPLIWYATWPCSGN